MFAYHVITDKPIQMGKQMMLVDGTITVIEIIKERNANIE